MQNRDHFRRRSKIEIGSIPAPEHTEEGPRTAPPLCNRRQRGARVEESELERPVDVELARGVFERVLRGAQFADRLYTRAAAPRAGEAPAPLDALPPRGERALRSDAEEPASGSARRTSSEAGPSGSGTWALAAEPASRSVSAQKP